MIRVIFSFVLFAFPLVAKQKICLNMIVKDESKVIKRCLDSVKPVIDYWVIVDTGSKDGTQKIIKEHLKDIPGKLYERPWKNFGESRCEAFDLAKGKGDYILFMDADDILEFTGESGFPVLTQDVYNMWRGTPGFTYLKPQIVRGDLAWKWVGVTHEYLTCDQTVSSAVLENVKYVSCEGGARSLDPQKFFKNVKLLEDGLKKEPDNSRYMFYLAESYRDAGEKAKSIAFYQKRVDMGGWNEEVFWSKLQIARMLQDLGLPSDIVLAAYLNAHQYRPHRVEPLYYLAEIYNKLGNYSKAYEYLKIWEFIPKPTEKDHLFNMSWMEEYGLQFQLSICSFYVGNYQEALDACDKLLAMKDFPEDWRKLTVSNRVYPQEKLAKLQVAQK